MAAKEGRISYEATNGLGPLRQALAEKARKDYGLSYGLRKEVLIPGGSTKAVFKTLFGLLNLVKRC